MTTENKGLQNLPQTDPPDLVWENIEVELDNKRKRGTGWIFYFPAIAACLMLAAYLGLQVYTSVEEKKSAVLEQLDKTDKEAPAQQPAPTLQEKQSGLETTSSGMVVVTDSSACKQTTTGNVALSTYATNAGSNAYPAEPITTNQWKLTNAGSTQKAEMTGYFMDANDPLTVAEEEVLQVKGLVKATKPLIRHDQGSYKSYLLDANEPFTGESYAPLVENEFLSPLQEPLSTFSIDVDNASYSNARRMLQSGIKPPKDAIRIEEFINYFDYQYPNPKGEDPFSINMEMATCPWNKDTRVVLIGLHGKEIEKKQLPPSNLVFLIDVSGSMQDENKLPLVKQSLKLLVDELRPQDRIAVVTYAGAAGLVLPSTLCSEKALIKEKIDNLEAGGSTAGGEGIELAYKVARKNKLEEGNNRIILVTDGDFNVGLQTDMEMEALIKEKSRDGIFLTVCGFGMGNYKDSKMEILADNGNGNYYYIDNFKEGKKVFSSGLTGTIFTIAKDVKIQVEFNPKHVKAYRLIGYENRLMPAQDFHDDTKDAGELGAGHTVTALYEIIPAGSSLPVTGFTELKYQKTQPQPNLNDYGNEMLTVKLRYKKPKEDMSHLIERTLPYTWIGWEQSSSNLRFATGVTMFGMLLRESKFKGTASYEQAAQLVHDSRLNVENGFRDELLQLIGKAATMR